MKLVSLIGLLIGLNVCFVKAQNVEVIKYEEFFNKVNQPTEQLIVVNFWATWCGPCVEEMPHFLEVYEANKNNPNFKLLFVSMDRVKQLDKVNQFIKTHNIDAEVVLLDDNKRMNEWIPKVDNTWSGNIPVTVLYKNGEKIHFVGSELDKKELEQLMKIYLN